MRTPTRSLVSLGLAATACLQAANGPALQAEFASAKAWSVAGAADTLKPWGDISSSAGVVELGRIGLATLSNYAHPKGAFSVEVRFQIDDYGPQSTRWISDLVNTSTWYTGTEPEGTIAQGFSVRTGGGELYPVLAASAYDDASGYGEASRWFTRPQSASISRCLGGFSIATGTPYWKEVFTDRCLARGRWTHLVAVYDGQDMRLFLDGKDATDGWRVQAADAKPVFNPLATLHLGASHTGSWDTRHTFGKLDYVRIHDSAMTSRSIRESFKASALLDEVPQETECGRVARLVAPETGKWANGKTCVKVRLEHAAGCVDREGRAEWKKGDRIKVRFSKDPEGEDFVEVEMRDSVANLEDLVASGTSLPSGEVFVATALDSLQATNLAARTASTSALVYETARPIVIGATTGTTKRERLASTLDARWIGTSLWVTSTSAPELLTLDGRTIQAASTSRGEGWVVAPEQAVQGVLIVRTAQGSTRVLAP